MAKFSKVPVVKDMAARDRYLRKTYGFGQADYERLLEAQGGRCAICRSKPRTQNLRVDHNHATGSVDGLLCDRCNHKLLGGAKDSLEILEAAVQYMLNPPARGIIPESARGHINPKAKNKRGS